MTWLETLELRLPYGAGPSVERLLAELGATPEMRDAQIYRRATLDGDFLLEIHHGTESVRPQGSQLGLRLAAALRRWGVVYHAVWTGDGDRRPSADGDPMNGRNEDGG